MKPSIFSLCLLLLFRINSAHLGSGPRYYSLLRNLPTYTEVFCSVYDYVEKVDLSKSYLNPPPPKKKKQLG